jgi:hypothetical protein
MDKQQVWVIIKKEDIPEDRRTIKCKWIFKIKRIGICRERLVACGYSRIPGIDFNESSALVINNVSFVKLPSSKAEYVAISEVVKEINFIYYLLRETGIEVNLLITVKTDNFAAML